MTRIVKGKTLEEAKRITEQDILHELGGLPESKLHCPKLAVTTLQKAIAKYENRKRKPS
jgi:NifU-like protein involved in Fe-S cluster formation